MTTTTFQSHEVGAFWRYIASSLDRLVDLARTIDPGGLHWFPPAEATNSVAVLVVHTLGNAEENILETLCGHHVGRDRSDEFVERPYNGAELHEVWQTLRPHLEAALTELTVADLDSDKSHPRRGAISGRDVLIVVARHAAEHLGQAELTRDLWLTAQARSSIAV
jgi:hypothetical protein